MGLNHYSIVIMFEIGNKSEFYLKYRNYDNNLHFFQHF